MRFMVEIELGNDAMRTWQDIRDALKQTIGKVGGRDSSHFKPTEGDGSRIRDENGNTVGKWAIVPDAPAKDSTGGAHERTERAKMLQARKTTHAYNDEAGNGFCFECGLEEDHAEANHSDDPETQAFGAAWVARKVEENERGFGRKS